MSKFSDLTGNMSIYGESSTLPEGMMLGEKKEFNDGRVFRLAKNGGTALAAGKIVVQGDETANHITLAPAVAAVGDMTLTVTLGATLAAANEYAEGFAVNITTGKYYKIKSHPAAALSTALTLTLYDAIDVAIPITDDIDLVHNPYYGVIISVADQADIVMGVPPIAVTADYYFWLQTRGVAAVLMDETTGRGDTVTTGTGTVGAVEVLDAVAEPIIGHMIEAGVDTKYNAVMLCLE